MSMGPTAEAKGWKEGQRVGVLLFKHACNNCVGCQTHNDVRFCKNVVIEGLTGDGGMAEYLMAGKVVRQVAWSIQSDSRSDRC